jgi:Domain of unknown function (DUF6265)
MIKLFVTIAFASIMANAYAQQENAGTPVPENLHWLIGHWERTNSKAGRHGHERWDSDFNGFGVTMAAQDTLFVETLRIVQKDSQLYYVADVPENKNPVYFKFTTLNERGFVCENKEHDFPKRIAYEVHGTNLKVMVSGDDKTIEFLFVKK